MRTLRKGSKGEDVKTLQKAIGVTADGDFGVKTEEALKAWQVKHGLSGDGICGPKTWALIGVPSINITGAHIHTHISYSANRPIKYIAIHYTAGSTSRAGAARGVRNVFLSRQASADFVVDDAEIVQITPDVENYYCWSVGDKKNQYSGGGRLYGIATNKNTVSIEICSSLTRGCSPAYANHKGWYFTDAALNNAVKLVKWLMAKYNVPKENVVRHYDVSGKLCPGIEGWNDGAMYSSIDGKPTGAKNNSQKWREFWGRL